MNDKKATKEEILSYSKLAYIASEEKGIIQEFISRVSFPIENPENIAGLGDLINKTENMKAVIIKMVSGYQA